MKKNITITVDASLKSQAKENARKRGISISRMVEDFLKLCINQYNHDLSVDQIVKDK